MERLRELNKEYECGQVLTSEELNELVWFINLIIRYINNTVNDFIDNGGIPGPKGDKGDRGDPGSNGSNGKNGKDGIDGHSPVITIGDNGNWFIDGVDTGVSARATSGFNYDLESDPLFIRLQEAVQELINKVKNLAIGQDTEISIDINTLIDELIDILNSQDWLSIYNKAYFDDILKAYLIQIGLITLEDLDNGHLATTWSLSLIIAKLNRIEQSVQESTIISGENGEQINLQLLKADIAAIIENDYALAKMEASIADWPTDGPSIYSAVSRAQNKADKADAGLEALYEQYAGVISEKTYTASLLSGEANESQATTSLSSSFGEYEFDENGEPIYEEDDNGNPVFIVDGYNRAVPYTGIILKYLDEDNNIVESKEDAANATKKTPRLDSYGKVVIDEDNNIVYDLVPILKDDGTPLKKQKAFKVYYKADSYYSYIGKDDYIYELQLADNCLPYSSYPEGNCTYMDRLEYYTHSQEVNSGGLEFIKEGDIVWEKDPYTGVYFIRNYGPTTIAYRRQRKLHIKNSSGIITKANADEAFATLFTETGSRMYGAFVALTTLNAAFVEAVASAAVAQTQTGQASAKLIADASMYLARTLYKVSDNVWLDIATEEEDYLIGKNRFGISGVTRISDVPLDAETRIKTTDNGIEWVLDATYVYNGKAHSFEDFKKDGEPSDASRKLLYLNSDGEIIQEGNQSSGDAKKKKLIQQANAGVINEVVTNDYSLANLYAKIDDRIATITAVVSNNLALNDDGEYLYTCIANYDEYEKDKVYAFPENWQNFQIQHSDICDYFEPVKELKSTLTLSADQINIMGKTLIDRLVANNAFIENLTSSNAFIEKLNATDITAKKLDIVKTVNNIEYHIVADANNGMDFYNIDLNNDDFVETFKIFPAGSGFMSEGYIRWDSNGLFLYNDPDGESTSTSKIGMFTTGDFKSQVKENGSWAAINALYKDGSGILARGNIEWNSSGNVEVTGDISATLFRVLKNNSSNPSIEFTTMGDNYRGTGFENLNASGIENGEPIGLVYDSETNTPKYFFDFAPVTNGTFAADTIVPYKVTTEGASTGHISVVNNDPIYYVTDETDSNVGHYVERPKSNGTIISRRDGLFELALYGTTIVYISQTNHYPAQVAFLREYYIKDGTKYYVNPIRGYIVEIRSQYSVSSLIGTNLKSYLPMNEQSTVYKSVINNDKLSSDSFNVTCCLEQTSTATSTTNYIFAKYLSVNYGQAISIVDYPYVDFNN